MKILLVVLWSALTFSASGADFLDKLRLRRNSGDSNPVAAKLTQEDMIGALKEALSKGAEHAVASLGKEDGFLKDPQVRIPMPKKLRKVETTLRSLGQDNLADDFVATLNRAAEKAAPEALNVLSDSIRQMTLADARAILASTNNAATEYFRRTSETNLFARFYPIVQQATAATGVTRAYKTMMGKASFTGFGGSLLGNNNDDLDAYVTRMGLEGLFVKVAEQEERIRNSPAARSTKLLQEVFSAFEKSNKTP